jgi:hypothetical protein
MMRRSTAGRLVLVSSVTLVVLLFAFTGFNPGRGAATVPTGSSAKAFSTGPWTKLSPAATPGPRIGEGMTYAAMNPAYIVVFGGDTGGPRPAVLGDVWYYIPGATGAGTWGLMCPTGGNAGCTTTGVGAPVARWGMAFVEVDSYVMMFGGCAANPTAAGTCPAVSVLGDTWFWSEGVSSTGTPDGVWVPISTAGSYCPAPRYEMSATAQNPNAVSGPTLSSIFGGLNSAGAALGDTWALPNAPTGSCSSSTTHPWTQWTGAGPSARFGAQESYDTDVDNLGLGESVLYGGSASTTSASSTQTWIWLCTWTGCTWTQAFPVLSPAGRGLGGMAWDTASAGGEVILYGGYNPGTTTWYGDTWVYTPAVNAWANPATTGPGARDLFGFASDPSFNYAYLHAGQTSTAVQQDLWDY